MQLSMINQEIVLFIQTIIKYFSSIEKMVKSIFNLKMLINSIYHKYNYFKIVPI